MDLISAHRQGLGQQLAEEARGLTGRSRDHVQRAIVAHHLFDHSGGRHGYALLCAMSALAFEPGMARLRTIARRARWRIGATAAADLVRRIGRFEEALSALDAARCEAMWIAYRAAQHEATLDLVPPGLAALRGGDVDRWFFAHQAWFEAEWGVALEAAIADLGWPLAAAPVAAVIGGLRIDRARFAKASRKGLRRAERALVADKRLPPSFAANPAHHYYALQRAMTARRREANARFDDLPVEDCVRLAAAA